MKNNKVWNSGLYLLVACLLFNAKIVNAVPGGEIWSKATYGNIGSSIAIDASGNLYLGTAGNYVNSFTASGALRWRFDAGSYVGSSAALSKDGKVLYIGTHAGVLFAINTSNGSQRWRYTTTGRLYSSPAVGYDGKVYVGSADGYLYAINSSGSLSWRYATGGEIGSSPAVSIDGIVYVGSADGYLYALDAYEPSNRLKWRYLTTASTGVSTPSIADDGTIYVGAFDNKVYAIDKSGVLNWAVNLGGRVVSSPAIAPNGTVYVASYDNGMLYSLAPTTGVINWTRSLGGSVFSSPAIGADGSVIIGTFNNQVMSLTSANLIKWSMTTDSNVLSSPAIANNGTVYIASKDSNLYAIEDNSGGLANGQWPKFGADLNSSSSKEEINVKIINLIVIIVTSLLLN